MANNVSRKGVNMKNNQVYTWTAKQQDWLEQAQSGNDGACSSLFCSMKDTLETVHRYSQDGLYPAKFDYDFNYNGFFNDTATTEIYTAFRDAVRRFDATQGVPFGAYAVNDLRHRAMDWTRDRQNDRLVMVGQRLNDGVDGNGDYCVLLQSDYDSFVDDYYASKSDSMCDAEAHPVEFCEIMDLVEKIRQEVIKSGDVRLLEFMNLYLECCCEKKAMEQIAERMQVTRAMAYVYMDRLRALIAPKFGPDYGAAA